MNAQAESDPETMIFTRDIEVNGQTCVAYLNAVKRGYILVKIQMPDGSIHPIYDMGFPDESYALRIAIIEAQRIFAKNRLPEIKA